MWLILKPEIGFLTGKAVKTVNFNVFYLQFVISIVLNPIRLNSSRLKES